MRTLTQARPGLRPQPAGWSLTETLVALALSGVLMSWAWPRWAQARQMQFRQQAQMQLHQIAQELSWSSLLTAKRPSTLTATQAQVAGLPYRFDIDTRSASKADPQAYVLWAKPVGDQTLDPCGALWLDSAGRKGNASTQRTGAACWGRAP